MNTRKNIFTKKGYEKARDELERLKNVVRLEIAEKINEAISFGDLSENAAYQVAMELRDINENKIAELEEILANAKVVKSVADKSVISVGSKVKLKSEDGNEIEFEIVGTGETDIAAKKFNVESPLASAVLGKKKGDKVVAELPTGKVEYRVLSVE